MKKKSESAAVSRKSRRKLLIGTAAGIAAISPKWSKPVVNSVILPVHAQTTRCSQLVIPGETLECGPVANPEVRTYRNYTFEIDTQGCLAIKSIKTEKLSSEITLNVTSGVPKDEIFISASRGAGLIGSTTVGVEFHITVYTPKLYFVHGIADLNGLCPNIRDIEFFSSQPQIQNQITIDGRQFNVNGRLSGNAAGLTVSDIIVSPV